MGRWSTKHVDLEKPTFCLIGVFDCNECDCTSNKNLVDMHRQMFESLISVGATEKSSGYVSAKCHRVVPRYGRACEEVRRTNCELASKNVEQLQKVSTPCIDDHQLKTDEMTTVGELSNVFSRVVRTCLYLARIVRRDSLWSVNKLARTVTKWTKEPVIEHNDIGGGRSCARGRFSQGTLRCSCSRQALHHHFMGHVIFMSMCNDIDWSHKNNEEICRQSSLRVSEYAKDFSWRWTFLGFGCEGKLKLSSRSCVETKQQKL